MLHRTGICTYIWLFIYGELNLVLHLANLPPKKSRRFGFIFLSEFVTRKVALSFTDTLALKKGWSLVELGLVKISELLKHLVLVDFFLLGIECL